MKNITKIISVAIFTASLVSATNAATIKEKGPESKRAVETLLKELGGDHWPAEESMKVAEVGAVETESTFYHIYRGYLRESQMYRCIFFDNDGNYLGYYEFGYEPKDVEGDQLLVYTEDDPGPEYDNMARIPIPDKGPPGSIMVAQESAEFVKAPKKAEVEPKEPEPDPNVGVISDMNKLSAIPDEVPPQPVEEQKVAEYRDWTISWTYKNPETRKNETKLISVNAQFVELDTRKKSIIIMSAKNGEKASIPFTAISQEDKDYLTEFLKK